MRRLSIQRVFDVVTCLFSSIGYMTSYRDLCQAINSMALVLKAGGVLIIEPWLSPSVYQPGGVSADFIDQPGLKIARISTPKKRRSVSVVEMHYLIGRPTGFQEFAEIHRLGLFPENQYRRAIERSQTGLSATYDSEGLTGRGLWICRKKG